MEQYQGGASYQVYSPHGARPLDSLRTAGSVKKDYDKGCKSQVVAIEVTSTGSKITVPKVPSKAMLLHPVIVLQLCPMLAQPLSFEIVVVDGLGKRRFLFNTAFTSLQVHPQHAKIPLRLPAPGGAWLNVCVDVRMLYSGIYDNRGTIGLKGVECISVGAACRLRKIFTLKDHPIGPHSVPSSLDFPPGVQHETIIICDVDALAVPLPIAGVPASPNATPFRGGATPKDGGAASSSKPGRSASQRAPAEERRQQRRTPPATASTAVAPSTARSTPPPQHCTPLGSARSRVPNSAPSGNTPSSCEPKNQSVMFDASSIGSSLSDFFKHSSTKGSFGPRGIKRKGSGGYAAAPSEIANESRVCDSNIITDNERGTGRIAEPRSDAQLSHEYVFTVVDRSEMLQKSSASSLMPEEVFDGPSEMLASSCASDMSVAESIAMSSVTDGPPLHPKCRNTTNDARAPRLPARALTPDSSVCGSSVLDACSSVAFDRSTLTVEEFPQSRITTRAETKKPAVWGRVPDDTCVTQSLIAALAEATRGCDGVDCLNLAQDENSRCHVAGGGGGSEASGVEEDDASFVVHRPDDFYQDIDLTGYEDLKKSYAQMGHRQETDDAARAQLELNVEMMGSLAHKNEGRQGQLSRAGVDEEQHTKVPSWAAQGTAAAKQRSSVVSRNAAVYPPTSAVAMDLVGAGDQPPAQCPRAASRDGPSLKCVHQQRPTSGGGILRKPSRGGRPTSSVASRHSQLGNQCDLDVPVADVPVMMEEYRAIIDIKMDVNAPVVLRSLGDARQNIYRYGRPTSRGKRADNGSRGDGGAPAGTHSQAERISSYDASSEAVSSDSAMVSSATTPDNSEDKSLDRRASSSTTCVALAKPTLEKNAIDCLADNPSSQIEVSSPDSISPERFQYDPILKCYFDRVTNQFATARRFGGE